MSVDGGYGAENTDLTTSLQFQLTDRPLTHSIQRPPRKVRKIFGVKISSVSSHEVESCSRPLEKTVKRGLDRALRYSKSCAPTKPRPVT